MDQARYFALDDYFKWNHDGIKMFSRDGSP